MSYEKPVVWGSKVTTTSANSIELSTSYIFHGLPEFSISSAGIFSKSDAYF
jgi:hypothetical protein